ncbi:MAG TPA: hypothetical protein VGK16_13470 [Candidatus Limnocylindrales bacterium]
MDEATPPGPPHLADPRALQILSTEHWSLLTARSLVYNEFFSRGSMFLTLLSASLVALGFVYQGGGGGGPDFLFIVVSVLALDLFVGLATLGRLVNASSEELQALQAMNRLRHAYLEMVPTLEPYFSTGSHDDIGSVLSIYGALPDRPNAALNIVHGLTTMPGMLSVINASIAGGLAAAVVVMLGGDSRLALVIGLGVGAAMVLFLMALGVRTFMRAGRYITARFPSPLAKV